MNHLMKNVFIQHAKPFLEIHNSHWFIRTESLLINRTEITELFFEDFC